MAALGSASRLGGPVGQGPGATVSCALIAASAHPSSVTSFWQQKVTGQDAGEKRGGQGRGRRARVLQAPAALEQQQQMNEQHQLDTLEANRQRDLNRGALPNSGVSTAQRALVDQQYDRQRDRLLQDMANTRARMDKGKPRLKIATAAHHSAKMVTHSSSEPSCPWARRPARPARGTGDRARGTPRASCRA